jgi:HPt (histidine-containing phosphotransfer) domain-containing protein
VLDRAAVLGRLGNNKQILGRVFGLFHREGPGLLGALREALARGDAAGLARAAHALKGALGNLGAVAASRSAREVEDAGRGNDLGAAAVALTTLEGDVGRFREALGAWEEGGYA